MLTEEEPSRTSASGVEALGNSVNRGNLPLLEFSVALVGDAP